MSRQGSFIHTEKLTVFLTLHHLRLLFFMVIPPFLFWYLNVMCSVLIWDKITTDVNAHTQHPSNWSSLFIFIQDVLFLLILTCPSSLLHLLFPPYLLLLLHFFVVLPFQMHYILLNFDVRTTLTLVQCRTSTPLNLSPSLELSIPSCCMSSPRLYCNTMTTAHTVKDSHTMQHNLLFFIKPLILIARLFHFIAIQSTSFFPMFVWEIPQLFTWTYT